MSKYTFEQYRVIFEEALKKYEGESFFAGLIAKRGRPAFPNKRRDCAVICIRHEGFEVGGHDNRADDTIALVRIDSDNLPEVWEYPGTTESGFWKGDKKHPHNPEGDFKMSPGFYWFKHGFHHDRDECLVQDCPVIGERFQVAQGVYIENDSRLWQITDGSIHLHAGINDGNPNVGNWSAGCTVIAGGWGGNHWKQFYKYCKMATNIPIPYVLVNESDIDNLLAGGVVRHEVALSTNGGQVFQPFEPSLPVDESPVVGANLSTSRFNKERFWSMYRDGLRRFSEKIQTEEVPHVENILDRASIDPRIRDLSQLACMIATARWETNRFRNLYEKGDDQYLSQYQNKNGNTRPGDFKRYRGTGYVHLTFRDNFRKAGQKIGVPLEDNPSLAADPHWAYEIMVRGSLEGWFTGKRLGDYIGDGKRDFRRARRVINPRELDIADEALRIAKSSRSKRQQQCVDALDALVNWAGVIEECLRASEVEDREVLTAPPREDEFDEPGPMFGGADMEGDSTDMDPEAEEPQVITAEVAAQPPPAPQAEPARRASVLDGPKSFIQASVGSVKRLNATIAGAVVAAIAAVRGFVEKEPVISAVIFLVAVVAIIWLVTWYIHVQSDLDKKRMDIAADPNKNNVR